MPRIFTPPSFEFNRLVKRILIRNCDWTEDQLKEYSQHLSDKEYDIYIYHDRMNDIQWYEGVRSFSAQVLDYRNYKTLDPVEWLKSLDDYMDTFNWVNNSISSK
jgi:hypothetical protein